MWLKLVSHPLTWKACGILAHYLWHTVIHTILKRGKP